MKRIISFVVVAAMCFALATAFLIRNNQEVFIGDCTKNPNSYVLEFEKMNREDSCLIPACKGDVFAVSFRIEKGHADLIIGPDGRNPIYKGNDIENGEFNVIVPEDGEYRITVNAKHAAGSIEVYAGKD